MPSKVAIIYNDPQSEGYQAIGESKAEIAVLDEVQAVNQALAELKYSSVLVPLHPPLEQAKKKLEALEVDVVFNLFEGFAGCPETEAEMASILTELKIPFTGSPASTLALCLDKVKTKEALTKASIQTPHYQVLTPDNIDSFQLDYPCIVKPVAEDASHGLSEDSVVYHHNSLESQVRKICGLFGGQSLVEEFVEGREFNTTVIGNGILRVPAISEIIYTLPPGKPKILTFAAKWQENSLYYNNTPVVCPAPISPEEKESIARIAIACFKLVGCKGYARVDLRQDEKDNLKVLEVNPNPDITPGSGAARHAVTGGMTYHQFIHELIDLALK